MKTSDDMEEFLKKLMKKEELDLLKKILESENLSDEGENDVQN